jgi:hypothetical protein
METIEKRKITYQAYLAAVGLLVLVDQHNKALDDLRKALYAVLEVEVDRFGHNDWCDEAIWNNMPLNELIKRLDIEVG